MRKLADMFNEQVQWQYNVVFTVFPAVKRSIVLVLQLAVNCITSKYSQITPRSKIKFLEPKELAVEDHTQRGGKKTTDIHFYQYTD